MSALTNMPFGAGQSQPPITTADKTTADWENLLGPSGFEQHLDKKRNIKESRLHIPDRPGKVPEKYLGLQPLLQSRVDGNRVLFLKLCLTRACFAGVSTEYPSFCRSYHRYHFLSLHHSFAPLSLYRKSGLQNRMECLQVCKLLIRLPGQGQFSCSLVQTY